ncbi:hypothetical protein [Lactococcus kimchii]|uniref:hypothetical protein n=1 Tax=Lactococcus sp. S-13 TaxID=2507158 RepID=UPI001022F41E|nr:hypothetical protein [Lactococcus sp. S-13]RZI49636.1 hypothetical protein EQJ87_09480 [Lactococcus sp. S-13]
MIQKNNDFQREMTLRKAYRYNTDLYIWILVVIFIVLLRIIGIPLNHTLTLGLGLAIIIFAVMLHIQNIKLKRRSVPSILIYIANVLSIGGAFIFIIAIKSRNRDELDLYALINIVNLLIQIVAAIFAFKAARELRKEYLTLI